MKKWKTISSELAFNNKWFKVQKDVVELPNGKIIDDYYLWNRGDVVLIVAITKAQKIVLVRQYKHGGRDIFIEVPAGWIEDGENVKIAAERELIEETGFKSDDVKLLTILIGEPTKKIGKTYVYLAENVVKIMNQKLDENEDIEVTEYEFDEVINMIYDGKIIVPSTIAAIFLAMKEINYKI